MAAGYFRQARARKPSKITRTKRAFHENAPSCNKYSGMRDISIEELVCASN
jgi:hypothetical protein